MLYTDFDEWAFTQCVTLGHTIERISSEASTVVIWINTTTLERFYI